MAAKAKKPVLPEVVVPPELEQYAKRWERMCTKEGASGQTREMVLANRGPLKRKLYSYTYGQLLPLYENHDLSWEDFARMIGAPATNVTEQLGTSARQFFPTAANRRGKSPKVRERERRERERAFIRKNELFRKLKLFCAKAGLEVSPVWFPSVTGLRPSSQYFEIGGVLRCYAGLVTRKHNTSSHVSYLQIRRPVGAEAILPAAQSDFGIWFAELSEPIVHHAVYVFPCDQGWPGKSRDLIYVPITPSVYAACNAKRTDDLEQYRDERGLALLKAAVEAKRRVQKL